MLQKKMGEGKIGGRWEKETRVQKEDNLCYARRAFDPVTQ